MKLKGINPLEQHVEKIVLGAAAGIFLIVFSLQFLIQPNRVKVGTGPAVAPERAFEAVEAEARSLAGKIRSTEPPLPAEAPPLTLLEDFRSRMEREIAPRDRLAAFGPAPRFEGVADAGPVGVAAGSAPIALPGLPAPSIPYVNAFNSTIDPFEALDTDGLRELLPQEQPFDKAAVSIEATFDGSALKAALQNDPDGEAGPARAMPANWWRDSLEIISVEVEREELTRDGEWSDLTKLAPLPGRFSLMAEIEEGVGSQTVLNQIVGDARKSNREILRPEYYRTIAGPTWIPPSEVVQIAGAGPNAEEIARAQGQLVRLDDRIASLGASIAKITGRQPAPDDRGGRPPGRKRGADPEGGDPRGTDERPTGQQIALERQLKQTQDERAKVVEQLAGLGVQVGGPAGAQPGVVGAAPAIPGQAKAGSQALLDNSEVRVWSHDLTAEPGKTYRYRMNVVINNPAFGRAVSLPEEGRALAEQAVLRGAPSEWSEPVTLDEDAYFFIVSAAEGDALGGPRAAAELYEFYYGYWRRSPLTVEPGDAFVGEARLPETLRLYELEKIAARRAAGEGGAGQPLPGPGGKGRGFEVGGAEGGAGADGEEIPDTVPAPRTLTMAVDAFLLDVARAPAAETGLSAGSRGDRFQAYIRNPAGEIMVRQPDAEQGSDLYKRVVRSAQEGVTQGAPEAKEEEKKPQRPGPREQEAPPVEEGGGGGGG